MAPRCHELFGFKRVNLMAQQINMQRLVCKWPSFSLQVRHLSRRKLKSPKKRVTKPRGPAVPEQLAWRFEKSDALRTALMRQYEEEERPRWSRNTVRIGQSFDANPESPSQEPSAKVSMNQDLHKQQKAGHEDVQCGIFWDIENVHNESYPPAIVIEAIRDFAGCSSTPVFQAYMSRQPLSFESRVHAIYAQLGVTFIQCHGLGKDTADKKIISDMWKFYVSAQKSSPNALVRIILITGDRDFADAIGQLRNFGVEIGILTGHVQATAPVFDDYTLGMRVLPLLGIVEARARDHDLNIYQASKRLSLSEYQSPMSQDDFEDEESGISMIEDELLEEIERKGQEDKPEAIDEKVGQPETAKDRTDPQLPLLQNDQPVPVEPRILQESDESQSLDPQSEASSDPEARSHLNQDSRDTVNSKQSNPSEDTITSEIAGENDLSEGTSNIAPAGLAEVQSPSSTDRADRKGFFSRLKGLFKKEAEPALEIPKTPATTTESLVSITQTHEDVSPNLTIAQPHEGGSPDISKDINITPEDKNESPPISTDTRWTSAISCRKLTQPIPIEATIFAASTVPPPSILKNMPRSSASALFASRLANYPGPFPIVTSDLIKHYREEVFLHKPPEVDVADMGRMWTSWLRIESWSNPISEESIRHAARVTLTKAHEHASRRREVDEWRKEKTGVQKMAERTVFEDVLAGNAKSSYPLTEQPVSSDDQDGADLRWETISSSKINEGSPSTPADIGNTSDMKPAPSPSAKGQESPQKEVTIEQPQDNVPNTVEENPESGTSPSLFEQRTSQHSDLNLPSQLSASLAVTHVESKAHTT